MARFLSAVFLATSIFTFDVTASATEEKKNLLDDCYDEPAAVSSLQSLIKAASLVRSQARTPMSTKEAAAKLDTLPSEASVATFMEAFGIPASVGFEVAELNRESRLAQSALIQKTGGNYSDPYDPCRTLFIPQYKYKKLDPMFDINNLKQLRPEIGEQLRLLEQDPVMREKLRTVLEKLRLKRE